MSQRKTWIDTGRGIMMMWVLLVHTEIYYMGFEYPVGFTQNRMTFFFIMSGYLFYKAAGIDYRRKLKGILRGIIMPYFIFMSVLQPVKHIFYNDLSPDIIIEILAGKSSWFVAALVVAEIIFLFLLYISRNRSWLLPICCVLLFSLSAYMERNGLFAENYWYFKNGIMAILFICAGYYYHKYEDRIVCINRIAYISILLITLIIIKVIEYQNADTMIFSMKANTITNYPMLIADGIVFTLLFIELIKRLPPLSFITYPGSKSLVFYFFCGACPVAVTYVANKSGFGYDGSFVSVIIVYAVVYMLDMALTYAVYRYIPFAVGKRRKDVVNN